MSNPFKRGSAPDRAQPADRRSGSFKQGHEKRGGRNRHGVRLRHRDLVNRGARRHPASIPEAAFLHTKQTLYLTALIGVRSPCLIC
jgi:hypothetical protein